MEMLPEPARIYRKAIIFLKGRIDRYVTMCYNLVTLKMERLIYD